MKQIQGKCERCGWEGRLQPFKRQIAVYYKVNGWVGDQFVPYDQKVRAHREGKQQWLCKVCWELAWLGTWGKAEAEWTDRERYLVLCQRKSLQPAKRVSYRCRSKYALEVQR